MYSTQTTNGLGVTDGSGTINPAALSGITGVLANPNANVNPDQVPRGIKRSRSPDAYDGLPQGDSLGDGGDAKSRKRRPMMKPTRPGVPESPNQHPMPLPPQNPPPPQTPQAQTTSLPSQRTGSTPAQASPPKSTPTKTVIKALPTVRDHTTDQLGPQGDEYVPREYDEAGEKKVTETGHLHDGRGYKCRSFFVPNRGDKLFMLATECARVLGYRDSYLLFNKNRSLYKIIATQAEKEDLIHQEILPFSYRSRQIAIVTAKSMFRQFGSRVIVNGRRVRDDYWEGKARKQGFTEEDMAGEKRPGAAKARDAAAAEANASASLALAHHGDIVYSNSPGGHFPTHPGPQPQTVQPGMMGAPGGVTPLPMITLAPDQPDMRLRDFSNIQRPRQEITGPAYQDRTQTSPPTDLLTGAHQAAEYNKQVNSQRSRSTEFLDKRWRTPHEAPSNLSQPSTGAADGLPSTQALQSPRTTPSSVQQSAMPQSTPQHLMSSQPYSQAAHQPNPVAQSPMRSANPGPMRPDQIGRPPGLPMGSGNLSQGTNPYTSFTPQTQMWPPAQAQAQAQASSQHAAYPSYGTHPSQQSPHLPQSSHQQPPPQLRHSGSNPQMQPALQYPGMPAIGQGYPAPGRGLYQQDQGSQQFMQPTTSGPQPGVQGWAPQQTSGSANSWGGWSGQGQ
ncbi:chromatin remodelling complex Rsc7/Swp82 subunit-domain-containing protein [Amylocarpus encephaloides]|uniref:Chromatin remodelling complex Rsc7/Swp82 subunit-domain-containing protein n=1 Tax=Amylocarpus encephaloides TaxID=45428 RepID=A0A9P8C6F5_9HELO|nr:chromatin remodelling complex Rsc7/Swp82 subunit-domain-containing protein [Amylocarpus encephaloides]